MMGQGVMMMVGQEGGGVKQGGQCGGRVDDGSTKGASRRLLQEKVQGDTQRYLRGDAEVY